MTNLSERLLGEVRRMSLPRNPVNGAPGGSYVYVLEPRGSLSSSMGTQEGLYRLTLDKEMT